jgi:hypothetical protein
MRGRDRPGHNFPNLKSEPEIPESAPEIFEISLENSGIYLQYPNILNYLISRKCPI